MREILPTILRPLVITIALTLASIGTEAGELKMSYNSDWPPYSAGVGNEVKGILPALMTEIVEKHMGMTVAHHGYPWKRAQRAVEMGQLDAFVTVPTDARLSYADSSKETVYTIEMHPIVAAGSAAEQKISAAPVPSTLRSLRVCEILGNGWGKRFAAQNDITPIMATKVASCLRMVAKGRTEVTVQALAVANQQISGEGLENQLSILPIQFGQMNFTLLLSKKSAHGQAFLQKFDRTVKAMLADGSYSKIVHRLRTGGAK